MWGKRLDTNVNYKFKRGNRIKVTGWMQETKPETGNLGPMSGLDKGNKNFVKKKYYEKIQCFC